MGKRSFAGVNRQEAGRSGNSFRELNSSLGLFVLGESVWSRVLGGGSWGQRKIES